MKVFFLCMSAKGKKDVWRFYSSEKVGNKKDNRINLGVVQKFRKIRRESNELLF